jgi:hypothetical protein
LSSFFLPQFFPSFLPTCLPRTPTLYTHLLCLPHAHFTICFIVIFAIITTLLPPTPLTFAIIAYSCLCAFAYFCHHHLLPPTFAIIAYSRHRHLLLPPYSHLFPPSPPLQVPRLLAYLIVYLFEL